MDDNFSNGLIVGIVGTLIVMSMFCDSNHKNKSSESKRPEVIYTVPINEPYYDDYDNYDSAALHVRI